MSLLWNGYRVLAPALGALAPAARVFTSPLERELWSERMGDVRAPGGVHVWVHAASLGETSAVPPLLSALRAVQPDARAWCTSTTRTGRDRLAAGESPYSLAPIDAPQAARRFFRGVRPERVLLLETELWPHWLMRAALEEVPVAVVSARLSERSVQRYQMLGPGMRALVQGLAAVLCQSETDAQRWRAIGAVPDVVRVVGNLKEDGLPEPAPDRAAAREARGLDPQRAVLVLGSVRPGEVRLLARAWNALPEGVRAHWQVVSVPRHARALDELRAEAAAHGLEASDTPHASGWRWDARTGVLNDWYRTADAAFVGGSLVDYGGHNPLEPAACGAAVLMGTHHASQRSAVEALTAAGGVVLVRGERELAEALRRVLGDATERQRLGVAAQRVAGARRGAAVRAVAALQERGLWPCS